MVRFVLSVATSFAIACVNVTSWGFSLLFIWVDKSVPVVPRDKSSSSIADWTSVATSPDTVLL